MLKAIVIFSFLACLLLSLGLFLSRDTKSLRENIEQAPSHRKPRVVIEEFVLKRYHSGSMELKLVSNLGVFIAPNLVEFSENVEGLRKSHQKWQSIKSQVAFARFNSENLIGVVEEADLSSVVLKGSVEIEHADHVLRTEAAEYSKAQDKIFGDRFVRVEGPSRWFTGENGFRLFLESELLDVFGKIKGRVNPIEK